MVKIRLDYLKERLDNPPEGSAAWCGSKLGHLSEVAAKYKLLTGRGDFDQLLAKEVQPYMAYRLRGERGPLLEALRDNVEALRINFEGYTSEVRWTDRVLRFPNIFVAGLMFDKAIESIRVPNPMVLYSTATGDPGGPGYFPMNAVRWLTRPRGIAALVTETGEDRFSAELCHFGQETRAMSAELYLLSAGKYAFSVAAKDGSGESVTKTIVVEGPRTRVAFELPARKLCVLRVRRVSG
jgi:hypothetical protein